MARMELALALIVMLTSLGGSHGAAAVLKITYTSTNCSGAAISATTSIVTACPAGVTATAACKPEAAGSVSTRCLANSTFASPYTAYVPAAALAEEGTDLTFVPDNCGKPGNITVSVSGKVCKATGKDSTAPYCIGPNVTTVSFAGSADCTVGKGINVAGTPLACAVAGKRAGYCLSAAVPEGCKDELLIINPELEVISCVGGGPGGKTYSAFNNDLPAVQEAIPSISDSPAGGSSSSSGSAAASAKSAAGSAALSAGLAAAAGAAVLLMA